MSNVAEEVRQKKVEQARQDVESGKFDSPTEEMLDTAAERLAKVLMSENFIG